MFIKLCQNEYQMFTVAYMRAKSSSSYHDSGNQFIKMPDCGECSTKTNKETNDKKYTKQERTQIHDPPAFVHLKFLPHGLSQ